MLLLLRILYLDIHSSKRFSRQQGMVFGFIANLYVTLPCPRVVWLTLPRPRVVEVAGSDWLRVEQSVVVPVVPVRVAVAAGTTEMF